MELQELAGRIRNGDKNALKELIAAYGGDVYQKAYAKTGDPELAREATRQTFAQFVGSLQNESGSDGWALWLDALAGKNIETFRRVSSDVDWVGRELDSELFGPDAADTQGADRAAAPVRPAPTRPAEPEVPRKRKRREALTAPQQGIPQPSRPVTERRAGQKKTRSEELFPTGPVARKKKKRRRRSPLPVILLFLVCALLLWAVAGVAMSLSLLPKLDLGYQWFNETLFRLF